MRVDVSRTTGNGWALRLRFDGRGERPVHALPRARRAARSTVDAREVEQPGAVDEELSSPYVNADGELDLAAWARDALALTLPGADHVHAGLRRASCPQCGANLNEDPDTRTRRRPDPRWSKLSEIRFE